MLQNSRCFVQYFFEYQFFKKQQNTVIAPPQYIIPICAMPDSGQHPDNQNVADLLCDPAAVSAQRNIDIFFKPGTK